MPRAIIITALPVEYLAVKEMLVEPKEVEHSRKIYEQGIFSGGIFDWDVLIAQIGMGNAGAALETERALNFFKPEIALFVGVAGGIKDVNLGDVIAGSKVYDYEYGKSDETFLTRPDSKDGDYQIVDRAVQLARDGGWQDRIVERDGDSKPKAIVGPIAAGSKVVVSKRAEVFKLIRSHYNDAVAVEMEGHGFLQAVHANEGVRAIVIRGISDLIEGKADADAGDWQTKASRHAAAFAFELLSKVNINACTKDQANSQHGQQEPGVRQLKASGVISGQPPVKSSTFFGRTAEVQTIHSALGTGKTTQTRSIVICGLSGMGKTQLALEYMDAFRSEYELICWIRAHDQLTLMEDLDSLAETMGITQPASHNPYVKAQAAVRALGTAQGWLLIFDDGLPEVVRNFMPTIGNGHVIVTSVDPNWKSLSSNQLRLSGIDRESSLGFLLLRTQSEDRKSAETIADALGDLPLALEQTAAYVEQSSIPLSQYVDLLSQHRATLMATPSRFTEYPLSVYAAFQLHHQRIVEIVPDTTPLLYALAVLDPRDVRLSFSRNALTQLLKEHGRDLNEFEWLNLISTLKAYSFIEILTESFSMHTLLHSFLADSAEEDVKLAFVRFLIGQIRECFPVDFHRDYHFNFFSPYIDHFIELRRHAKSDDLNSDIYYEILNVAALYLHSHYRDVEALVLVDDAVRLAIDRYGRDDRSTSSALMNKASILSRFSRKEEAIALMDEAVRILSEDDDGSEESRERLGVAISNLGWLHLGSDQYDKAEQLLRRASEIHSDILGEDSSTVAIDLNNLGSVARERRNWEDAYELYSNAVRIHRMNLPPTDLRLGIALRNLASAEFNLDLIDDAYSSALESLRIMESIYGGTDHPELAESLQTFGLVIGFRGDYRAALDLFTRALALSISRGETTKKMTQELRESRSEAIKRITSPYIAPASVERIFPQRFRKRHKIGFIHAGGRRQIQVNVSDRDYASWHVPGHKSGHRQV